MAEITPMQPQGVPVQPGGDSDVFTVYGTHRAAVDRSAAVRDLLGRTGGEVLPPDPSGSGSADGRDPVGESDDGPGAVGTGIEPGAVDAGGVSDPAAEGGISVSGTAADIGYGLFIESPGAASKGIGKAGQAMLDLSGHLADWFSNTFGSLGSVTVDSEFPFVGHEAGELRPELPELLAPRSTVTGKLIQDLVQFAVPFTRMQKAVSIAGLAGKGVGATVGRAAAAGAITDLVFRAGSEPRLSDFLRKSEHPAFNNAVTNYLASDPEDSEAEARFKGALEGLGLGVALDGAVHTFRLVKHARQAQKARGADRRAARTEAERASNIAADPMAPVAEGVTAEDLAQRLGAARGQRARVRAQAAAKQATDTEDAALKALTGGEKPADEVFLNLNRIDEPDDIREAMKSLLDVNAPAVNKARGGEHQSFDAVQKLADDIDVSVDELLTRTRGEPMSAPQAVAYRKMMVSSGKQVRELAQAATTSGKPADLYAFRKALAVHHAIQSEVIDARTATARALASWRIGVKGDMERADAIRMMLDQGHAQGAVGTLQMARAVQALDTDAGLARFARDVGTRGQRTSAAVKEMWINGLLSSPKTHAVNVLSNSLTQIFSIPERWTASAMSRGVYSGEIPEGEALELGYAMVRSLNEAFVSGAKALRTGESMDLLGKIEIPHGAISAEALAMGGMPGRVADFIGNTVRLPGRFLQAEDDFFKTIGYRAEVHARAFRQATSEGLEGDALASRVVDLTRNPDEGIRMAGANWARYQTFTNELGPAGKSIMRMANTVPGMRFILPFIRTPANIMKYSFERTPAALLMKDVRARLAEASLPGASAAARAAGAETHARIAMGTSLMLLMADFTRSGHITGAGPSDPALRNTRRRMGIPPYGIKIGDRWYAYNRLDPIGMSIGMAADIAEIQGQAGDEDAEKLVAAGAAAFAKNLANRTYLSGAFDLIEVLNDPDRRGTSYLAKFAASFVPYSSLIRNTERATDPILQDTASAPTDVEGSSLPAPVALVVQRWANEVRHNTPGFSAALPPRRQLWGEPIDTSSGIGAAFDFISPVYSSLHKPDPIDNLILDNRIKLAMPTRSLSQGGARVKLTGEEYSRLTEVAGKGAKDQLDSMMAAGAFEGLSGGPDGLAADMVRQVVSAHRQAARVQIMIEFPALTERLRIKQMRDLEKKTGASIIDELGLQP